MGGIMGTVCSTTERHLHMRRKQLTGQRFGKLLVQCWDFKAGAWACLCDCGRTRLAPSDRLLTGRNTSCGCARPKHGGKGTRAFSIWQGMLGRCRNRRHKNWADYGGRGIIVCERWQRFENFLADMGQPGQGATIERRDNAGNYEPGNCFWADRRTQARNTRRSIVITHAGKTQSLAAWAEELGANYWLLHSRHKLGWAPERMFADLPL